MTNTQEAGTWVQTGPLTFNRPLTGADRVYEQVSEVPELKNQQFAILRAWKKRSGPKQT